ncbi:hypothetical protein F3K36_11630 [Delftia sp. BR1]|jgi:hypothetical protein|nr:hypothetical protein F3K36_11630 [Delftia sp. BR1]
MAPNPRLKQRIIFLDFDGVLHPPKAIAGAKPPLTPKQILLGWPDTFKHLYLLANLLNGHEDISVVVSSSWRLFLSDAELLELLRPIENWFEGSIGKPGLGREEAIREFISLNKIPDFIILDDVPAFFKDAWTNLIICPAEEGISDDYVHSRVKAWIENGP